MWERRENMNILWLNFKRGGVRKKIKENFLGVGDILSCILLSVDVHVKTERDYVKRPHFEPVIARGYARNITCRRT